MYLSPTGDVIASRPEGRGTGWTELPYATPIKDGVVLKVRHETEKVTVHRKLFKIATERCPIFFNRASVNNQLHSVLKRVARDSRGGHESLIPLYRPEIQCFQDDPTISEEEAEEYLASTNWPAAKKQTWRDKVYPVIQDINQNLWHVEGLEHDLFIKNECYPGSKYPRAIQNTQPPGKALQVFLLWRYNKAFFALPYFPKHLSTADRVDRLRSISRRYFYATDFTSFESSIGPEAHALERAYFNLYLNGLHLTSRDISGTVPLARMSGDFQTSLGNSIINYCLNVGALADQGIHEFGIQVEGDDAFITTDQPIDEARYNAFMLRRGFILKLERHETPGAAGFCGLFFGPCGPYHKYDTVLHKLLVGPYRPPITVSALIRAKLRSAYDECPASYLFYRLCQAFPTEGKCVADDAYNLRPGVLARGAGVAIVKADPLHPPTGDTDLLYGINRPYVDWLVTQPLDEVVPQVIDLLETMQLPAELASPWTGFRRSYSLGQQFGPLLVRVAGDTTYMAAKAQ